MKLNYKILWLDDQIKTFIDDRHILKIEKHLSDEGFNPEIYPVKTKEEFFDKLDNSYDLILTDYHMKGMNGAEIVKEVRKNIFTEILFYTAQGDLKDISKLDRISFLQTKRIHHKEVVKKAIDLINLTIEKFHDIVVMRGMIMNETSDLDNQKIALIKKFIDKNTPELIDGLKLEILSELDEKFSSKLRKVQGEWKVKPNGFTNLIKDNFVFSASYKIKTLGWILNQLSENNFSNEYNSEIINIRNLFAHATLEEDIDENGKLIRKFFKKGDITFDSDYCKVIRQNINKHKQNLDNLKIKLDE
ncbi:MAG: response regulator [Epsilonproteobacteria bacterium]|nr:MAG: response regulator [Campylobacterota bacterium]